MKGRLEKYALFAEIAGGIAIVLSLIFVGLQINQSNSLNKAAAYRELISSVNDVFTPILTDKEINSIWVKLQRLGMEALDDDEIGRIRPLIVSQFRVYDSAFYSYEYSTLGEIEWDRIERLACGQKEIVNDEVWNVVSSVMSLSFVEHLENSC